MTALRTIVAGWVFGIAAALAAPPAFGQPVADVLVLGSEPEAIAAAIAAAETGAEVRLLTPDARLGGLFTLGALNVLDLRTRPFSYQRGLFDRWWRRVGGGPAFDPARAERAFERMLAEAGVEVTRAADGIAIVAPDPAADGGTVTVRWSGGSLVARQLIDGEADLRFLRAAGATASFGWRAFGVDARMADTLVFRVDRVDWTVLRSAAERRGRSWAVVDDAVAWGSFGGVPAAYEPNDPTMRLRGLNLGRDDRGGVWVNALLIHDVDPFDPASRADGRRRATAEADRVVAYLAERMPGFASARLGSVADRLYVRETVHLDAACVLDADHLLDNSTGRFDVAVGGYPLDLQSLTRHDDGFVFGAPELYGVPLCVTVPAAGPDRAWAVGRSVGYDPVAHASARVVPLGMALGEAVGIAAALAAERSEATRALVDDAAFVEAVRRRLRSRDAFLPEPVARSPVGPYEHPHFAAFRKMLGRGLAVGGYANDPDLDAPGTVLSSLYLTAEIAKRFAFRDDVAHALVQAYGGLSGPADAARVAPIVRAAACRLELGCPEGDDPTALRTAGLWPGDVPAEGALARGELYAVGARLADRILTSATER